MQAGEFIRKWGPGGPAHDLTERAGAQAHFIDLCRLLGVPEPDDAERYCFERGVTKTGSAAGRTDGFADVWLKGCFAWEYKAPGKSLDGALRQLMQYALPLESPHAEAIAHTAKRLVDLRDAWLNPPEWTERVPEVVPLGMTVSPYPDRIVAKPGFEKELAKRTLTNLYNQRPAWLAQAHEALDAAVAAAYGWVDYTPSMPDDEILRRLLALNLERSGGAS
jgi:hypothetical protein